MDSPSAQGRAPGGDRACSPGGWWAPLGLTRARVLQGASHSPTGWEVHTGWAGELSQGRESSLDRAVGKRGWSPHGTSGSCHPRGARLRLWLRGLWLRGGSSSPCGKKATWGTSPHPCTDLGGVKQAAFNGLTMGRSDLQPGKETADQ